MTASASLEEATASRFIAAELRAEIARAGVSHATIATRMAVPGAWVSRRLAPGVRPGRTPVDLTFEEVEAFCGAIGTDPEAVIVRALRARRDSNPKPSDLDSRPRLRLIHGPRIQPASAPGRVDDGPARRALRAVS